MSRRFINQNGFTTVVLMLAALFAATELSAATLSITSVTQSSAPGTVNLTTDQGTPSDWVHWGNGGSASGFDRKAGVPLQLSTFQTVTTAGAGTATIPITVSWSDGTPTAVRAASGTAVAMGGIGNGFQFALPAGTTTKTLKVYCGVVANATGRFEAYLTDGSAVALTNSSVTGTTFNSAIFTVEFAADSENQMLVVRWTMAAGTGSIYLQSATLSGAAPTAHAISARFQGNAGVAIGTSEPAGVAPRINWNNLTGQNSAAPVVLISEAGPTTSATVTWTANGVGNVPIFDIQGDFRSFRGFISGSSRIPATFTVSNLPVSVSAGGYSVYVYVDSDGSAPNTTRSAAYTLNATTISATDSVQFSGTFVRANNGAGNYVLFENVTGSSFTVSALGTFAADGFFVAPINGFQIVNTAFPSKEYVWTGLGGDAFWSNNGNWAGGVAPVTGANVIFPAGVAALATAYDLAPAVQIQSISFFDNYSVAGPGALRLIGDIVSSGNGINPVLSCDVVLQPVVAAVPSRLTANDTSVISMLGTVSGTGALTLNGAGTVILAGNNTYGGGSLGTNLVSGTLTITSDSIDTGFPPAPVSGPLGVGTLSFGAGTLIAGGGPRVISNSVTLSATVMTIGGNEDLTLLGTVNFNGGPRTITINNTSPNGLTLGNPATTVSNTAGALVGPITGGSSSLTKNGPGQLTLTGAVPTNVQGFNQMLITAGKMVVSGANGKIVDGGVFPDVRVDAGATLEFDNTILPATITGSATAGRMADGDTIQLNGSATFILRGNPTTAFTETITNLQTNSYGTGVVKIIARNGLNTQLTLSGIATLNNSTLRFERENADAGAGEARLIANSNINTLPVNIDDMPLSSITVSGPAAGSVNLPAKYDTLPTLIGVSADLSTGTQYVSFRSGNWDDVNAATTPWLGNPAVKPGVNDSVIINGDDAINLTGAESITNVRFAGNGSILSATDQTLTLGARITSAFAGSCLISARLSIPAAVTVSAIGSSTVTLSNEISGAGSLTKTDTGTLILGIDNIHTGGTILLNGILAVPGSTAAGLTKGPFGTGTLTLGGASTGQIMRVDAASTIENALTLNGTFLISGSFDLTFSGNAVMTASSTIACTGTGITAFTGVIAESGTRTLGKSGLGTLRLAGANTFNNFTLFSGPLQVAADSTGANPITAGPLGRSTFTIDDSNTILSAAASIEAFGAPRTVGNGVNFNGDFTIVGANDLTVGSIPFGAFHDAPRNIFVESPSTTLTIGSPITTNNTTSTITKSGPGTLLMTAVNSYNAPTVVSGGKMVLHGDTGRLSATQSLTLNRGGTFEISGGTSTAANLDRLPNTAQIRLNGGTFSMSATASATVARTETVGPIVIDGAGRIIVTATSPAVTGSCVVTSSAPNITFNPGGSLEFTKNDHVSGSTAKLMLNVVGNFNLPYATVNGLPAQYETVQGLIPRTAFAVTIADGDWTDNATWLAGSPPLVTDDVIIQNNVNLDLNRAVNSLTFRQFDASAGPVFAVNTTNNSVLSVISGAINSTGNPVSTLGVRLFFGPLPAVISVAEGTSLNVTDAILSGSIGGVTTTGLGSITFAGGQAFGGGLRVTGGLCALTGANSYTGGTIVSGSALGINSDDCLGEITGSLSLQGGNGGIDGIGGGVLLIGADVTLNDRRPVIVGLGGGEISVPIGLTLTVLGTVSGNNTLNKTGDGRVTFAGTGSTRNARTNVRGGILRAGSSDYLGSAGTVFIYGAIFEVADMVAVNSNVGSPQLNFFEGSTLRGLGLGTTTGTLNITGNTFTIEHTPIRATDFFQELSNKQNGVTPGQISTTTFVKANSGRIVMTGSGSYEGTWQLQSGILQINAGNAFGDNNPGPSTITVNPGTRLVLNSDINTPIILNGGTLSAASFTRNVVNNAGFTPYVGGGINTAALTVVAPSTIALDGGGITCSSPLIGSADLTITGTDATGSAFTVNYVSQYTGTITVNSFAHLAMNGPVLPLVSNIRLAGGTLTARGNAATNAIFDFENSISVVAPVASNGNFSNATINVDNAGGGTGGTIRFSGLNIGSEILGITGGNSYSASFAGSTLTGNPTFNCTTANLVFGGGITDNGGSRSIFKTGTGTLFLNGANTYTGQTVVSAGTVQLDGSTGSIAGNITLNSPGTFLISATGNAADYDRIPDTAIVTLNGGSFTIAAPLNVTRTETIGRLVLNAGNNTVTATGNATTSSAGDAQLIVNETLQANAGGFLRFVRNVTGTAQEASNLIINDTVNFADDTLLPYAMVSTVGAQYGFVPAYYERAPQHLGVAPPAAESTYFTIANGNWESPSVWNGGNVPPASADVIIRHTVVLATAVTASANQTVRSLTFDERQGIINSVAGSTGTLTVTSGLINMVDNANNPQINCNLNCGTAPAYFNTPVVFNGTLTVGSLAFGASGGSISGTGLIKAGAAALTLNGSNNFTGTTTLAAGTLNLGNDKALSAGELKIFGGAIQGVNQIRAVPNDIVVGGDFAINGSFVTVFNGTVTLSGGDRTITINNFPQTTFNGVIRDDDEVNTPRGLTKTGGGAWTLNAANTFGSAARAKGLTVIANNSILTLGHDAALGEGPFTLNVVTTIQSFGAPRNLANSIILNSDLFVNGSSPMVLNGQVLILNGGRAINVLPSTLVSVNGVVSGTQRRLIKQGLGELILNSANTMSESTSFEFQGGVLTLNHPNALGAPASGVFTSGGTPILQGGPALTAPIPNPINFGVDTTLGGSTELKFLGTISFNGFVRTLTVNNSALTTFAGAMNSGGLIKTGSGTLVLEAANTNPSGVTVNAGTVRLKGDTARLGNGGSLTLNGGTFEIDAQGLSNPDRIPSATPLIFGGGSFVMTAPAGANRTETVGAITIDSGSSNIRLKALGTGNCQLTASTSGPFPLRNSGSFNFEPTIATGTANLYFTGGLHGTYLPYATVNGHIAVYDGNASFGVGLTDGTAGAFVTNDDGDWQLPGTWAGGVVPAESANVIVRHSVFLTQDVMVRSVAFDQDNHIVGTYGISGAPFSLTVSNGATVTGSAVVFSGSVSPDISVPLNFGGFSGLLIQDGIGTPVISGPIGGTAGIVKSGAGTLILQGSSNFTPGLSIVAGTLSISSDAQLGAPANGVSIVGGTLRPSATMSSSRAFTFGVNTLPGGTIEVPAGLNLTLSATLASGVGTLTKSGQGTLAFGGGASTRTGPTVVNAGELRAPHLAAGAILGSATVTVNNNAVLHSDNPTGTGAFSTPIALNDSAVLRATGNTTNGFTSSITLGRSSHVSFDAPASSDVLRNGFMTGGSPDSTVTITGPGRVVWASGSSFGASIFANNGQFNFVTGDALGLAGNILTVNPGAICYWTGLTATLNPIVLNGGTFGSTSGATMLHPILVAAPSVISTTAGATQSNVVLGGVLSGTQPLTINGTTNNNLVSLRGFSNTYSGTIHVGTTAILEAYHDSLGTSAVHPTIALDGGTLQLRADFSSNYFADVQVTADSTIFVDRATPPNVSKTLSLGGLSIGSQTLRIINVGSNGYSLEFNGTSSVNGAPSVLNVNAMQAAFSGSMGGSGSLVKNGNGTLVFSAANSYAGSTTVDSGLLQLNGASGTLGAGDVTVGAGMLYIDDTPGSNVNRIPDTATVRLNGGHFVLHAPPAQDRLEVIGNLIVSAGTLDVSASSAGIGKAALTLTGADAAAALQVSGSLTFNRNFTPGTNLANVFIAPAPAGGTAYSNISVNEPVTSGSGVYSLAPAPDNGLIAQSAPAGVFTYTSIVSGNWNDSATWDSNPPGGTYPDAAADAVISAGHTVTLTANEAARQITFMPNGVAQSSSLAGNFTLAVSTGGIKVATPDASAQGLRGDYYQNNNFTGTLRTQLDPQVNNLAMPAGQPTTNFTVIWTGFIQPDFSGIYTISFVADDSVRLFFDNQLLGDAFVNNAVGMSVGGQAGLTAGQLYPVRIEYAQAGGPFSYQLNWSNASQTNGLTVPIPAANLRPSAASQPIAGAVSTMTIACNLDLGIGAAAISNNGAGALNVTGAISNAPGGLAIGGNGNVYLTNSNTYGGGSALSSGILTIGHPGALSSGNFTILGGMIQATGGTFIVPNAITAAGDFSLGNTTTPLNLSGNILLTANRTVNAYNNFVTPFWSGVISDNGNNCSFTKGGSGGIILRGKSTYGGSTTILAALGTSVSRLTLGTHNALPPGTTLNLSAFQYNNPVNIGLVSQSVFEMAGFEQTVAGLGFVTSPFTGLNPSAYFPQALTSTVINGNSTVASTLTIDGPADINFYGSMQGRLSVVKNGNNTLKLFSSASNYNGSMTVNGGTLMAGQNSGLPTAATIVVNAGTVVDLNGFSASVNGLAINGGTVRGGAVQTGGLFLTSDLFNATQVGGQPATIEGVFTFSANRILTVTSGGPGTDCIISGPIGGAFSLTKFGNGTLKLAGDSLYTGTTNIDSGTLVLDGNSGTILNSPGLVVNQGATFMIDDAPGAGPVAGRITNSATVTLNGGSFVMASPPGFDRTETIGTLAIGSGGSTIKLSTPGSTKSQLTAATVSRVSNGTFNFDRSGTNANLYFANGIDGTFYPYATVNGTFSIYNGTGTAGQGLIEAANISTYTVNDGEWGNPATWNAGVVPAQDASSVAIIRHNVTLKDGFGLDQDQFVGAVVFDQMLGAGGLSSLGGAVDQKLHILNGMVQFTGSVAPDISVGLIFGAIEGTLLHNSSATITLNGTLSGTTGIVKSGTGTLILTNTNSDFTPGIALLDGTLSIGSDASDAVSGVLGRSTNAVNLNGGAFAPIGGLASSSRQFNANAAGLGTKGVDVASGSFTLSTALGGTGTLGINASAGMTGELILVSASARASGRVVLNNGTLTLNTAAAMGSAGVTGIVNSGVLAFGNFTTSNPIQMFGGTLRHLTGTAASLTGALTIVRDAQVNIEASAVSGDNCNLGAVLGGGPASATSIKIVGGPGRITATSAGSTYYGSWVVDPGATNAMLVLATNQLAFGNTASTIDLKSGRFCTANQTVVHPIILNGGTIGVTGGGTFSAPVSVLQNSIISMDDMFTPNNARNMTFSGLVTDSGPASIIDTTGPTNFTPSTSTIIVCSNPANNLSGRFRVNPNSSLRCDSTAIGNATIQLNGGLFSFFDNGTGASNTAINYANNIEVTANSFLTVDNNNGSTNNRVMIGGLTMGPGDRTLAVGSFDGYSFGVNGTSTLKGDSIFTSHNLSGTVASAILLAGPVVEDGGSFTLTKAGTSTATLAGANTYTGQTGLLAGTLVVTGGSAIVNSGTVSIAAGVFSVLTDETFARLIGAGSVTVTATATLTIGDATDFEYGGSITGGGILNKQEAGRLTLTGGSTYSGGTLNNDGSIQIGSAGALGTGSVTCDGGDLAIGFKGLAGQYLNLAASVPATLANLNNLNNTFTSNPAALVTLNAPNAGQTVALSAINFSNGGYGTGAPFASIGFTQPTNMIARWTGRIFLPAGVSTLFLTSDDGSCLWLDGNIAPLVNNNGSHGPITVSANTPNFAAADFHEVTVGFFQGGGGSGILFEYTPAGGARQVVPIDVLFPSLTVANNFSLSANTDISLTTDSSARLSGIVSGNAIATLTNGTAGTLTLAGKVTGGVALTKEGSGLVVLDSAVNDYSGATLVNGGKLNVSGGNAITDTSLVTISPAGTLGVTASETIGDLVGSGSVTVSASVLSTGFNDGNVTYGGTITGNGGLTKIGAGTFTLSGASTHSGATTVSTGALEVSGSLGTGSAVTVNGGATLFGSGAANGPILVNGTGTLAPGAPVGMFGTGSVTLSATANFPIQIDGPTAGSQYDRLNVTGTVTLNNAVLNVNFLPAYVPPLGTKFIIIDNDGTDPVVGTFAGLPNFAPISLNGTPAVIAYNDGSGNDVSLFANRTPTANIGGPYSMNEGSSISLDASASSDPDGDALTYDWDLGSGNFGEASGVNPAFSALMRDDSVVTIRLRVTDFYGYVSPIVSTTVTVNNVNPTLTGLNATAISENGTTTLTGTINDPGRLDTFTLAINWGDTLSPGNTQTVNFPVSGTGTQTFSITHQYLDDNPTGDASNNYTIALTITDDDTGSTASSTNVTVTNANPTLTSVAVTPTVNENGSVTLTGNINDVGTLDTFTLVINWGDPLSLGNVQTVNFPVSATGTQPFSFTHQYLDDNPAATPSDSYTINLTITDDDTGTASAAVSTTVNNVVPALTVLAATTISENGSTTLTGNIVDPGTLDTFVLSVNWGDPLSPNNVQTFNFNAAGGSQPFSLTHQYLDDNPTATPSDVYTISLTITDDDTGTSSNSTSVTVNNVNPALTVLAATTINENGSTTLSGNIVDPGTLDTFTLSINWGDPLSPNNVQTFNFNASATGTQPFSLTHQYLDDNPTATPSNNYTINLTITDDDTGSTNNSTIVTVNNVAPTLTGVSATTISENGTTTLSGTISDPGTLDTFTLAINWGDPLSAGNTQTVNFNASATGTQTFSLTHQYLDDNPTGNPTNNYTIGLTITDDDTGSTTSSPTVTVNNVAPTLTAVAVTPAVNENGTVTLTGNLNDVGRLDTFTLVINWGDPLSPNNVQTVNFPASAAGTQPFSITHQYLDDNPTGNPANTYAINLTVTDDDTGTGTAGVSTTVNNVAPALTALNATTINENGTTTLTGTINDPGTLDTFVLSVNWGDPLSPNNVQTFNFNAAAGSQPFSLTHQYLDDNPSNTPSDTYTISLTITDDDTGSTNNSATVTVNNVNPTLTALAAVTVSENGVSTLTGTINDPGTLDTFTLTINWGDPLSPNDVETFNFNASATGSQPFSFQHQYLDDNPSNTPSDTYTINLTITDDDSGSTSNSTTAVVNNAGAFLNGLTASSIDENGVTTLMGVINDAGTLDTFTIDVNWGDPLSPNNIESYTFAASATGNQAFLLQHQYLDDNPTATPGDTYTVTLSISDDDTSLTTSTTTVVINNVDPVLALPIGLAPVVPEHTLVDITVATFTDIGSLDTHSAVIDWGDGSPLDTNITIIEPSVGTGFTGSIIASHMFDDGPALCTVSVTLFDDDGGVDSDFFFVEVESVAPVAIFQKADTGNVNYLGEVEFVNQFDPSDADTLAGLRYSYDFAFSGLPNFTFGAGDGTYAGSLTAASIVVPAQYITNSPNHTVLGRIIDKDGSFTDYVLQQPDFHTDENDSLLVDASVGQFFSYNISATGVPDSVEHPIVYQVEIIDLPAGLTTLADTGLSFNGVNQITGVPLVGGMLTLRLIATNLAGSDAAYLVITINGGRGSNTPQIISRATANPNPSLLGTPVTFSAVATDADGDILSYYWTFGDGTSSRDRIAVHTYSAPGTFKATLVVADAKRSTFQHLNVVVLPAESNTYDVASVKIAFDFKTPARSQLQITGKMPVPAVLPVGTTVDVTIPDSLYAQTFILNSKMVGGDNVSLFSVKVSAPGTTTSTAKFVLHLKSTSGLDPLHPSLFQMLTPLGYLNKKIGKPGQPIDLQLNVVFNTATPLSNFNTIRTIYTCVFNKKGTAVKAK